MGTVCWPRPDTTPMGVTPRASALSVVGSESVTTRVGCEGRVTSWPEASVTTRVSLVPFAPEDEAGAGCVEEQAPRVRDARARAAKARTRVEICTCSSIRLDRDRCIGKPNLAVQRALSSHAMVDRLTHTICRAFARALRATMQRHGHRDRTRN